MVCRQKKTCVYIRCPVFVYGWKKVDGLFFVNGFQWASCIRCIFPLKISTFCAFICVEIVFRYDDPATIYPSDLMFKCFIYWWLLWFIHNFFCCCFIRALEPMKKYREKKMVGDWHIFNRISKHTSIFQVQQKRKPTVIGWIEVNVGLCFFFVVKYLCLHFFSYWLLSTLFFIRTITSNFTFNSREKRSNAIEKRYTVYFKT